MYIQLINITNVVCLKMFHSLVVVSQSYTLSLSEAFMQTHLLLQGGKANYDKPAFTEKLQLQSTSSNPVWADGYKVRQCSKYIIFKLSP